jgi:hypothetical protein
MEEHYIEGLEEMLVSHGCHIYELPTSLNPSIKRICNELGVHIYDAPSAFESGHLYLGFTAAITYALNKVIVIHTYDFNDISHLEVALWHEIGHIVNDNHGSEKDADNYAIKQLMKCYGETKGKHLFLRWLFVVCELNLTTGEFKKQPKHPKDYSHRNEWIRIAIAMGLEHFKEDFE